MNCGLTNLGIFQHVLLQNHTPDPVYRHILRSFKWLINDLIVQNIQFITYFTNFVWILVLLPSFVFGKWPSFLFLHLNENRLWRSFILKIEESSLLCQFPSALSVLVFTWPTWKAFDVAYDRPMRNLSIFIPNGVVISRFDHVELFYVRPYW